MQIFIRTRLNLTVDGSTYQLHWPLVTVELRDISLAQSPQGDGKTAWYS